MIIGITGPAGSGKDTASEYIAQKVGGVHVSGGDVLREMLTSVGLEPKKTALGDFGTFLRTHFGPDVIGDYAERKFPDAHYIVVSGFRSPAEAMGHQRKGGVVIYIDAPYDTRFQRIQERGRAHDVGSPEALKRLDTQEATSTDAMAENLDSVKNIADAVIMNDGGINDLHTKLDGVIAEIIH